MINGQSLAVISICSHIINKVLRTQNSKYKEMAYFFSPVNMVSQISSPA